MRALLRTRKSAVPKKPVKRKQAFSLPDISSSKPFIIKSGLLAIGILLAVQLHSRWGDILEMFDQSPIKGYALLNQPKFTTNADIRAALSLEPALKGYFSQDIQAVADKLKTLPWVREVVVRKIWPDRLSITLLEHQPVALWNNIHFVSDQGVVFSLPAGRFDKTGLPILFGPDSQSKAVLEAWNKIGQDLQSRHLQLKSVSVDSRGSWSITLANDVELRLGRGEWLPKIDRFVSIYPHITVPDDKRLFYVDLRYEHGAAVGFRSKE